MTALGLDADIIKHFKPRLAKVTLSAWTEKIRVLARLAGVNIVASVTVGSDSLAVVAFQSGRIDYGSFLTEGAVKFIPIMEACDAFFDLGTTRMAQAIERIVIGWAGNAGTKECFGVWNEIGTA